VTMIDEDVLRMALRDATDDFAVSDEAIARILATAECDEAPPRTNHIPKIVRQPGRPRTILAAVAALVAVTGVAVPLLRSENQPPRASANSIKALHGTGTPVTGGQDLAEGSPSGALPSRAPASTITGSGFSVGTSQKIESTGTVSLAVAHGHVQSTFTKLSSLAVLMHGQVESTQANSNAPSSTSFASGTIVLEVPQHSFSRFVSEVERIGHATSVTTTSNNVTSQYVDLQARITALNASLAQYLTILKKATTISDILAVQNQINTIQSEIEQDQGQLKVLANQTTYGSLTVNVTQTGHHSSAARSGFNKAWHDSLRGFVAGFEWLVRLAGPALFALILLGALYEIAKYSRRAIRRRRI
jgi:hypothetical protein